MADSKDAIFTFNSDWKTLQEGTVSQQFLGVDDTKRIKASSDPGTLHICVIPEITVTGEDGTSSDCKEDGSNNFLHTPFSRPRSNTCPEEMFQARKGRPPTPPPVDVHKIRNPAGKRFSFNFNTKDFSVSFTHHRLSKVKEEKADQQQKQCGTFDLTSLPEDETDNCNISKTDSSKNREDTSWHLKTSCDKAKPSSKVSCDACVYDPIDCFSAEYSSSRITNNNKVSTATNDGEGKVTGCSVGSCRSIKDGTYGVESRDMATH